ncbi:MAG: hypothetical protein IJ225_04465 [Solobacterium sp.]|nr:hypothetical protein [Solobacterium sp.]
MIGLTCGFTPEDFSLARLKNYKREYKSVSIGTCSTSSTKTYEDYRLITSVGSAQYQYIHNHCTVDEETGFLFDEGGFIGAAMGYSFGEIGSRYYIVLDTGIIIPVVKVDAKAAEHAPNGCSAGSDASVIEFVIDTDKALAFFGGANGLASSGNFNNYEYLQGNIADIEAVSDEPIETGIIYTSSIGEDRLKRSEEFDRVKLVEGGFRS